MAHDANRGIRPARKKGEAMCYHEAGHAVVSRVLGGRVFQVVVGLRELVEITPGLLLLQDGLCTRVTLRSLRDELVVAFAGIEAQYTLLKGRAPTRAELKVALSGDQRNIAFCTRWLATEPACQITEILDDARERARTLVLDHRADIERVARALLRRGSLTGEDLDALLGPMTVHNEMGPGEFEKLLRESGQPFRVKNGPDRANQTSSLPDTRGDLI